MEIKDLQKANLPLAETTINSINKDIELIFTNEQKIFSFQKFLSYTEFVDGHFLTRIFVFRTSSWRRSIKSKSRYVIEVLRIYDGIKGCFIHDLLLFHYLSGYRIDESSVFDLFEKQFDKNKKEVVRIKFYSKDIFYHSKKFVPGITAYGGNTFDNKHIFSLDPSLKYLANKLSSIENNNVYSVFSFISNYKINPSAVESLILKKYFNLAQSKQLFKLSLSKQKAIVKYIKDNPNLEDPSLSNILFSMKNNISYKQAADIKQLKNYPFIKDGKLDAIKISSYLDKKNIACSLYIDYLEMINKLGNKLKDPYWLYPNNFEKNHARAIEIISLIEDSKNKRWDEEIKKISAKYNGTDLETEKYKIFIPKDLKEIKKQSIALHQCLMTSGYYKAMANLKIILVLITDKSGNPIATAEIKKDGSIGQFYTDEISHKPSCCIPNYDIKESMN